MAPLNEESEDDETFYEGQIDETIFDGMLQRRPTAFQQSAKALIEQRVAGKTVSVEIDPIADELAAMISAAIRDKR
ncbi:MULTISPECIES: hypothetical protein [Rhodococcus]|uniref:hypothetical protein n=1 Tax=Rhodococcus TaxID=1827 RepID=UPI0006428010|nr:MULTISPECIES: hypothetical protein [Rhodococcus]AZI65565.1 hypothetical protein EHW12_31080 [Rhodococcus sp. NJ-530]KLN72952.1 hypothetical protein ABM90_03710 [Rhodococcus erythropolis]